MRVQHRLKMFSKKERKQTITPHVLKIFPEKERKQTLTHHGQTLTRPLLSKNAIHSLYTTFGAYFDKLSHVKLSPNPDQTLTRTFCQKSETA